MSNKSQFGPEPKAVWVPIEKCYVDPAYQRSVETRRGQAIVEKIAGGFKWRLCGALQATKTKKGYAILDGGHRLDGMAKAGVKRVLLILTEGLTPAEQAAMFIAINTDRVAMNAYAIHHAKLAMGEARSRAIDACCRSAGVSIPRNPIPALSLKPGQTLGIGAIAAGIARFGDEATAQAMTAIIRAWPTESGTLRSYLILAVGSLLKERGTSPGTIAAVSSQLRKADHLDFDSQVAKFAASQGLTRTKAAEQLLSAALGPVERRTVAIKGALKPTVPWSAPKRAAPSPAAKAIPPAAPAQRAVQPATPVKTAAISRRNTDGDVAAFIAKKGVTKCPPAYLAPVNHRGEGKFKGDLPDYHTLKAEKQAERGWNGGGFPKRQRAESFGGIAAAAVKKGKDK